MFTTKTEEKGKRVQVVGNIIQPGQIIMHSYTQGEWGTILKVKGIVALVKLDNDKKYPFPYRYSLCELRIMEG